MIFLESCTVKVAPLVIEKIFDVGFNVNEDRFLVGFSKFVYGYDGNKDHNVREIFLELKSDIIESTKIKVSILGVMFDNSKNEAFGEIGISVFAFSEDEVLSNTKITAITRFRTGYKNKDHHLQAYGANSISFLHDASGHHQDINDATQKDVFLPIFTDATYLEPKNIASQAAFISEFSIEKEESDCCVKRTGLQAHINHPHCTVDFIFDDKHKEQKLSSSATRASVQVLYKTTEKKLALSLHKEREYLPFMNIKPVGNKEPWAGWHDSGSWAMSHIQGFASYTDLNIRVFSHSDDSSKFGYLIFSYPGSPKYVEIATYDSGFNHPGGIQTIDNYLLVPCEKCGDKDIYGSYIRLYDMSSLKLGTPPTVCKDFVIHREKDNATAAGITKYRDCYGEWYLIVILNRGVCDFYKSKADRSLPQCDFKHISRRDMRSAWSGYDVQCINLLTEANDKNLPERVFMIAFATKEVAATFEDHALLMTVIPKVEKDVVPFENEHDGIADIIMLNDRHFTCQHSSVGQLGVHFRFGAALEVKKDKLVLYATGRNFTDGEVLCNFFDDISRLSKSQEEE